MRKPDFVVIGAQKAGSTYLLEQIGGHPQIYMFRGEDPHFLDPDYGAASQEAFAARYDRPEPIVGFKRPNYLGEPEVAPRIAADLPHAKLIAVLRNPVDRAISAYYHVLGVNVLPLQDAERGLAQILDGDLDHLRLARSVLEYGLYAKHLRQYLQYFDRDRLHLLLTGDIRSRPIESLQECYQFLGADPAHRPSDREARRRPMATTSSLPRLRIRRAAIDRLHELYHDRSRTRPRPGLLMGVLGTAYNTMDRQVLSRVLPNPKSRISAELRQRLYDFFADDIADLETILGRPLDGWRPTAQARGANGA